MVTFINENDALYSTYMYGACTLASIAPAGAEVWHLSCERYLAQMKSGTSPQRDQSSSSPSVGRDYSSQRSSDRSASVPASSSKVTANGSEAKKEQQGTVSSVSSKSDKPKPPDSPLGKFARSDSRT